MIVQGPIRSRLARPFHRMKCGQSAGNFLAGHSDLTDPRRQRTKRRSGNVVQGPAIRMQSPRDEKTQATMLK